MPGAVGNSFAATGTTPFQIYNFGNSTVALSIVSATNWISTASGLTAGGALGINGEDDNVKGGRYFPTVAVVSNATSPVADTATYVRVGNVVTVTGSIHFSVTSSAVNCLVSVSVPFASSMNDATDVGVVTWDYGGGSISGNGANTMTMNVKTTGTGTQWFYYEYKYLIK
jgi:hypothetical protein